MSKEWNSILEELGSSKKNQFTNGVGELIESRGFHRRTYSMESLMKKVITISPSGEIFYSLKMKKSF